MIFFLVKSFPVQVKQEPTEQGESTPNGEKSKVKYKVTDLVPIV